MTSRQKAVLALLFTLVLWCTPTVFVKYLLPHFDPWTQNFYRYASSAVFLLPWLVWRLRQRGMLTRSEMKRLFVPSIPNFLAQITWTFAMQWLYPAFVSLFNKSSILFSCALAVVFFPAERWLFRSRRFLLGLALSAVGTVGLVLARPDLGKGEINSAVTLVLLSALMWAAYSTTVKQFVPDIGSRVAFAVISLYTTLWLLIPALIWGNLSLVMQAPWHVNLILVVSGLLCIGLAHPLYYFALKELGLSVCATMLLSTPVGSLLLSHWVFGEVLTAAQMMFGLVLLAGGALTILVTGKEPPLNVAKATEPTET